MGPLRITIAWIGRTKEPAFEALTAEYIKRTSRFARIEGLPLRDESALLALCSGGRSSGAKRSLAILDSRGKQFSSEEFARFLENHEQRISIPLVLAIGPADGFSDAIRTAAQYSISLGKMTLAHELARVVLAEQVYRAFTILKGHPYHNGH